ncbi:hypothetical protein ABFX02_14G290600 [Erythranthe guttata]
MAASVLEECKINPPAESSPPEFVLPIVFFDMVWYDFPANQSVLFFDLTAACSTKPYFLETLVPDLKSSLSLTLGEFLPLAGKIVHPLTPGGDKPILRYVSGDSVSFNVCESGADFSELAGNHPRNCDDFYAFVPNLPPANRSEKSICCPVLALQVTLFPGHGFCIGFVTHHAAADACTVVSFIQTWALINKTKFPNNNSDLRDLSTRSNFLPSFDRKNTTNINGLDSLNWDLILKLSCSVEPPPVKFPIDKLRSTFVLKKEQIEKLKGLLVAANCPRLSTFTAACAVVWVCSAKSAGDDVADDEPEYFGFVADCRGRLQPPVPGNYFGNCVVPVRAELKHGQAKGPNGFVMAAKAIGDAIVENVYNENGILFGAEKWPEQYDELIGKRQYGVAGSPRFDFYAVDYGWGKPKKFEALFVDGNGSISLNKARDCEGGLEIGLSKPKLQMDVFSTVFSQVLHELLGN